MCIALCSWHGIRAHYSAHPSFLFFGWHDHEMDMKLVKAQSLPFGLWCPCCCSNASGASHFPSFLTGSSLPTIPVTTSGRGWKHLLNLLPNLYVDISFFIKLPKVIENWPLKAYDLKASWPMKGPLWLLHSPLFFFSKCGDKNDLLLRNEFGEKMSRGLTHSAVHF